MRVLACFVLLVCLLAILIMLMPIDPEVSWAGLWRAWQNPMDPTLDSITLNTMLEIRSYLYVVAILTVPALVGAAIGSLFVRR